MHKLIKAGAYGCHSLPGRTIRKNEMISDEDFAKVPDSDKRLFCSILDNLKSGVPTSPNAPAAGIEGQNSGDQKPDENNGTPKDLESDPDKEKTDPVQDQVNEGMKVADNITPGNTKDPDQGKRRSRN